MWEARALAAMTAVVLCAPSPLRAETVLVSDSAAGAHLRDEAGVVDLLLRTSLAAAGHELVTRDDAKRAGASTIRLTEARKALSFVGATRLVVPSLSRKGAELRLALRVLDQNGDVTASFSVRGTDSSIDDLVTRGANRLRGTLGGAEVKMPDTSVGQLRPYARALRALDAAQPDKALQYLRGVDGVTAGRVAEAREVANLVAQASALPRGSQLAALVVASPARALDAIDEQLASKPSDEVWALKALAHLASLETAKAAAALQQAKQSSNPTVLLARARLAEQTGDRAARGAALTPLLEATDVAALAFVSELTPGTLGDDLERLALEGAERVAGEFPRVAAGVALRTAAQDIERERSLKLLSVTEFSELEQRALKSVVSKQTLDKNPDAARVRAEFLAARGRFKEASELLGRAVGKEKAEAEVYLLAGRLQTTQGNLDAATAAFAKAKEQGADAAGVEHVELLLSRGQAQEAVKLLGDSQDTAAAMLARGRFYMQIGKHAEAIRLLRKAAELAPRSEDVQLALLDALTATGDAQAAGQAEEVKLLALVEEEPAKQEQAPTAAITLQEGEASATEPTESKPAKANDENAYLRAQLQEAVGPLVSGRTGEWRVAYLPLLSSGSSLLSLRLIRESAFERGLGKTLAEAPFSAKVVTPIYDAVPAEPLRAEELSQIAKASGADVLLLFELSPSGANVDVRIVAFDAAARQAKQRKHTFDAGLAGLTSFNPLYWIGPLLLLLVVGAILGVKFLRGWGSVSVTVSRDPAMEADTISLVITKDPEGPDVDDIAAFTEAAQTGGHQKGARKAMLVARTTRFEKVPAGDWFVHVFGTYKKGGAWHVVSGSKLTHELHVARRGRAQVAFNLVPEKTEIKVSVYDGQAPLGRALVWLNDNKQQAKPTDGYGRLSLFATQGQHIVHIEGGGLVVAKDVLVSDTVAKQVTVNLERERRMAAVSGGVTLMSTESRFAMDQARPKADAWGTGVVLGEGSVPAAEVTGHGATVAGPSETSGAKATQALREPDAALLVGLKRYRQTDVLGRGAMGVVYKANDLVLEREVALKIMSEQIREHPDALRLFQREAKALAALNHANIVTVFDQGTDGGNTFMVMEFVDGHTLEDEIEAKSLTLVRALEIVEQLCRGLHYAHARNIIHRDIKPANIFLSSEGAVKIGDFGLARVAREVQVKQTAVRGTPSYMAPEQIIGGEIDYRADLYAVGCTLFELLTGDPPFTDGDILYHHVHSEPPVPSQRNPCLPKELDAIFLSCVKKTVKERVQSAEALAKQVAAVRQRLG